MKNKSIIQRVILKLASHIIILTKELPEPLRKALKEVGYHKQDIQLNTATEISPFDAGGAGQKAFFIAVDLDSGKKVKEEWGSWGGANMFNNSNRVDLDTKSYQIPNNIAVIKGTTGSYVFADITVNSNTAIKALPETKSDLSENHLKILKIFTSITSGYRKQYLGEIEGSQDLIKELVASGYLKQNAAGSTQITTTGKNSVVGFKWNP